MAGEHRALPVPHLPLVLLALRLFPPAPGRPLPWRHRSHHPATGVSLNKDMPT